MSNLCKRHYLLPALTVGFVLVLAEQLSAQTFKVLYSFAGPNLFTADGPSGRLVLSGNTLYGTTKYAGSLGPDNYGTVFKVNTDGTGFTTLYRFTGGTDEAWPYCAGGLVLSGNTLYGTTSQIDAAASQPDPINPGTMFAGTVFAVSTDGSWFATLHRFAPLPIVDFHIVVPVNDDGAFPHATPILSGNTLYGTTTAYGGMGSSGTVYAVNTDGSSFTTLYNFTVLDGGGPWGPLIISGNILYGLKPSGTLFAINTDGTGFRVVHTVSACYVYAGLILSGNSLYGATSSCSLTPATVFKVNTDGTGFTTLHSFGLSYYGTSGELVLFENTLYGTGGDEGSGTVFAVNTDGSGFRVLHTFTPVKGLNTTNQDGAFPQDGLILSGHTLYGAAAGGGSAGNGTIFSIELPLTRPQLTITPSGTNVILSWTTNATDFMLQSTTNLLSPPNWATVSPGPIVISGQNMLTNAIAVPQQFFRLSQ